MNSVSKLQADVAALATPEGRQVGTRGHDVARDYLLTRIADLGIQPYRGDTPESPDESGGGRVFLIW